jgi:hypothetical protein
MATASTGTEDATSAGDAADASKPHSPHICSIAITSKVQLGYFVAGIR